MPDVCSTGSETAPLLEEVDPRRRYMDSSGSEYFESDPHGLHAGISIRALSKVCTHVACCQLVFILL